MFGNGTRSGDDTIEVGGNLLKKAKDWLAEQQGAGREDSPTLNKLADMALGAWFGNTISPGIHTLSGLSGSDTYKFSGIYGAAVVMEPNSNGADDRHFMDTLDLSATDYDVTIDVYHAKLQDIPGYSDLLYMLGGVITDLPPVDEVSEIMVVRDNSISEQLSSLTLGAIEPSEIFGDAAGNVILAFDIENLVLGEGTSTIRFHDETSGQIATIHGTVSGGEGGTVILDYSATSLDPSNDITDADPFDFAADGEGGIQWQVIPPVDILPRYDVPIPGTDPQVSVTIDPITYPGLKLQFADATRVEGNRLLGRDAFKSMLESWGIPDVDVIFNAIADQTDLDNWASDNPITKLDGIVLPTANVIADFDLALDADNGINGNTNVGGNTPWHETPQVPTADLVGFTTSTSSLEIEMKADAGVWQLNYNSTSNGPSGEDTVPLAANVTTSQLEDALNMLTIEGEFSVTGLGTADEPWTVTHSGSGPTAVDFGDFSLAVDNIQLPAGITAGLYKLRDEAESGESFVDNVSLVGLGAGDKLVYGSGTYSGDGSLTFIADDRLGKSMIVSDPSSPAKLQLDDSLFRDGTVFAHHFGSVSVYYTDAANAENYVIALQTQLVEHPDELVASWSDSPFHQSDEATLSAGLQAFADWSAKPNGLDDAVKNELLKIQMPFGALDLSSLIQPDENDNFFKQKIEALKFAVDNFAPDSDPTVDEFVGHLDSVSNNFSVIRNCNGLHGYTVEMTIAEFVTQQPLDLGSWSFDELAAEAEIDLPFDLGLSVESTSNLEISGTITLSFNFGLDADADGDGDSFYVSDPSDRCRAFDGRRCLRSRDER